MTEVKKFAIFIDGDNISPTYYYSDTLIPNILALATAFFL